MNKAVLKTIEAAATRSGAMDAGDHFKNGACSKSRLISGIAIMLLIICLPTYGQTKIATAEQFAALNDSKTALSDNYVLMNDLTLDNWMPIGRHYDKDGQGFSGTFDGNGHTITITGFQNSFDNTKIGLFGAI